MATELNDLLQDRICTFLYSERQKEIAGADGEKAFNAVFGEEARLVVVLHRKGWGESPWTRIEQTAIRGRGFHHGYDFVIFIPLDNPPEAPKWLPPTQLWIGLQRWGIKSAAGVIEARVQQLGGMPRNESAGDRAARLDRALQHNEKLNHFLNSTTGVHAAQSAFASLQEQLSQEISSVNEAATQFSLSSKKAPSQLVVGHIFGLWLKVLLQIKFTNSLRDSLLSVELWDDPPPFPGISHIIDKPTRLHAQQFRFTLLPSGEYGWEDLRTKEITLASQFSSGILKHYMDQVDKRKSKFG